MNKIKRLCKKYQQVIYTLFAVLVIISVVYFALHGFDSFVKWATTDVGSVADWAGSIGTILAFVAVIWQQGRQENITRAVHIEESRPRFSLTYTPKPVLKTRVLFWGNGRTAVNINEILGSRSAENYVRRTYQQNPDKFPKGSIRKFGKQWIVTTEGMEAITGAKDPRKQDNNN